MLRCRHSSPAYLSSPLFLMLQSLLRIEDGDFALSASMPQSENDCFLTGGQGVL